MDPDFFLVGAPRSGTTALCNYLRAHPELFISSPKEPTYFGRDLVPKKYPTLESYRALFARTGAAKRAGDGSVAYLASDFAAEEIHAFNPQASILIILRDPVEMMHSLHLKHYLMGIEPCRSLEDALAAEPGRLADGTGVPDGVCPNVIALRHRATYVPQITRFLQQFGAAQVKLFRFDDFKADPARVFHETCRFLGVRDDIDPSREAHNVGRQVKNARWHAFLTRAPRWAQTLARSLFPFPELRARIQKGLVKRNQHSGKPAPMSAELRARLKADFAPEVAELSRITGWDLSHWQR
jgi:hypothetical protein